MIGKLRPSEYEGFEVLPSADQKRILRAIAKRLRRTAKGRAGQPPPQHENASNTFDTLSVGAQEKEAAQ